MKKISLAFVVALIAYVASCSLPDPGCDDHSCDEKCLPLNKRHVKSMEMHVQVKCAYDSICLANIFFGLVKEMGWYSVDCYDKYEYTFVNESLKAKAVFGETISKVPLKEDHLRFSLFDEDDVEKKYDIDLSEIVHSYKYVGDSLEITVPDYVNTLNLYKYIIYGNSHEIIQLTPSSEKYVFFPDSMYKKYYDAKFEMNEPTFLGNDMFKVSVRIYYR